MYSYFLKCSIVFPPQININVFNPPPGCYANTTNINSECMNIIYEQKNKIDKYSNSKYWDIYKKLTNPYEFISITERERRQLINEFPYMNNICSIAEYEPLSRSFFKMIEMIYDFTPIIKSAEYMPKLKSVHLAEGPGGFIEAVRHIRRNIGIDDIHYGMTLKDTRKEIPGWSRSLQFLKNNPQVKIITGADETGNLYNTANIDYLVSRCGENSAYLITGDGGFDFSVDYNRQEQSAAKLIFAQILAALKCQSIGGVFICKFFDINKLITVEMLYLLQCFYTDIIIHKPNTSRYANSEKYIICRGYKYIINKLYWEQLKIVLDIWNKCELNNIFSNIPSDFINYINNINNEIVSMQIKYINDTINIIEQPPNPDYIKKNITNQMNIAKIWCAKYGF